MRPLPDAIAGRVGPAALGAGWWRAFSNCGTSQGLASFTADDVVQWVRVGRSSGRRERSR